MVPAQKRYMDDFVFTISDNEGIGPEEDELAATPVPPKKKAKISKKNKAKRNDSEDEDKEAPEGVWGKNDDDDGAMASDFEFLQGDVEELNENEFSGWGFDGAKKSMKNESKGVDLNEIIRRRLGKKAAENGIKLINDEPEASDDNEEELDINLDDDEDGVLADDAFGMEAKNEDEEEDNEDEEEKSDEEGDDNGDEDEDENDDTDSIATTVEHPDDVDSDEEEEDTTEADAEEAAKAAAFFAPEEPTESGPKTVNTSFQSMSLSRPILRGLAAVGFTKPTPIQNKTIPVALLGKDVVGGAVTGSGKTGAFIVPILERLLYRPKKVPTSRVVVLTPTRELAIQCYAVATKLAAYTDIKFTLAVGGLSLKAQEAELRLRPDVIIATPGRFIDHVRNSASFAVDTVEILVLDEADRMLEDGFADELNEILTTLPKSRQTMLFSATMTSSVDSLVRVGMNKPVRLQVDTQNKTATGLTQEFVRLRPGREEKRMGYLLYLCKEVFHERVIVFFRQKRDAHRARIIFGLMNLSAAELHGSMNQTMRISSVEDFRDGRVSFLLATDLASRGLDIKGVDIVINYEAPQKPEIYVHRVGRTARAGRRGTSCTLAAEPDRKVVKAAIKTAKAQGAKIVSRVIDVAAADKYQAQIDAWAGEITEIEKEEKLEKEIANVEMQVKKGENILKHEDEIKARPKRTWFESAEDKKKAKEVGRIELNGMREALKKKHDGARLSNKDKKKLDSKADREKTRSWKKGKAERMGQGAVLNLKKPKNKVAKKTLVKGKVKPKKGGRR